MKKTKPQPGRKIIIKKIRIMTNKNRTFLPETNVLKTLGQQIVVTLF